MKTVGLPRATLSAKAFFPLLSRCILPGIKYLRFPATMVCLSACIMLFFSAPVYSQGVDMDGENTDLLLVHPNNRAWGTGITRVDSVYIGATFLRDTTKSEFCIWNWSSHGASLYYGNLSIFIRGGANNGGDTTILLFRNTSPDGTNICLQNNPVARDHIHHLDTIVFKYTWPEPNNPLNVGYSGPNRNPADTAWKSCDYIWSPDTSSHVLTGPAGNRFKVGRRWCAAGWIQSFTAAIKRTDTVQFSFEDNHGQFDNKPVWNLLPIQSDFSFADALFKIDGVFLISVSPPTPNNNPPGFISAPDTLATEDQPWTYSPYAVDVDAGDTVAYSLRTPPSGMAIAGNKVTWTPTNANVGSNIVIIRATDSRGAFSDQTFRVRVINVNDAPAIISSAPTAAVENQSFQYQAQASDPDVGDVLTWQLTTAPTGMSISATGLVIWTPTLAQTGSNNVVIQVHDAAGLIAQQSFAVIVTNINDAPIINDPTAKTAIENVQFSLQLTAVDPDGNQVFWFVIQGPDSLKINMSTGLLTWTPRQNVTGTSVQVKIRATDAVLSDTTTFSIAVTAVNDPPVITTVLPTTFRIDTLYSIPLTATDEEGNTVTWSIPRKPATMSIVGNILVWAPTTPGLDTITIIATDGYGFDTLSVMVQVVSTAIFNSNSIAALPNTLGLSASQKTGSITITAGLPSNFNAGTITLFTISGKKLAERNISGSGWHTFSVANIPAGAHLLRLNAGGQMIMRKVPGF